MFSPGFLWSGNAIIRLHVHDDAKLGWRGSDSYLCLRRGLCTGIPGLEYPFGDQASDAVDIQSGFDFEAATRAGCL